MGACRQDDWRMPSEAGVGFVDVGIGHPGTELASFTIEVLQGWVPGFYRHLAGHVRRASQAAG